MGGLCECCFVWWLPLLIFWLMCQVLRVPTWPGPGEASGTDLQLTTPCQGRVVMDLSFKTVVFGYLVAFASQLGVFSWSDVAVFYGLGPTY